MEDAQQFYSMAPV